MSAVYLPDTRTRYVQLTNDVWRHISPTLYVGSSVPVLTMWRRDTAGTSVGIFSWAFANNKVNDMGCSFKVPNDWAVGTDIKPRIEFTTAATTTNTVAVWGLEYTVIGQNGVFPTTTTLTNNFNTGATSAQYKHMVALMGSIPAASLSVDATVCARIYRDGANVADTFTGTTLLLDFVISYQADSIGSKAENSKSLFS